jgi:endonuclease/exonuclease/phosphatase family metal-dependent hydrolase
MYKCPSSEASNLKCLNEMIMQATKTKEFSHQLIMGDFNFPKVNWKTWSSNGDKDGENFMECIRNSYLYQRTVEFTRTRENCEPSTLDLIFTNEEDMIEDLNYDSRLGRSEHCVLDFKFRCYCKTDEEKKHRDGTSIRGNIPKWQKK